MHTIENIIGTKRLIIKKTLLLALPHLSVHLPFQFLVGSPDNFLQILPLILYSLNCHLQKSTTELLLRVIGIGCSDGSSSQLLLLPSILAFS